MPSSRPCLPTTVLTVLGLSWVCAAEPTILYDTQVGGWRQRVFRNDEATGFGRCATWQLAQPQGSALSLEVRAPLILDLAIDSPLPPPATPSLDLAVDGQSLGSHPVPPGETPGWRIRIDEGTDALMALRGARKVSLTSEERVVSALLHDSTAAVEALIDCAELAASFHSKRPRGLRRLHPGDRSGIARRRQIRTLLRLSGFPDANLIPARRLGLPPASVAWESAASNGATLVELRVLRSLDELGEDHRALFMSDCLGEVETLTPPPSGAPGYTLVQRFFSCPTSDDLTVVTSLLDQVDVLSFVLSGRSGDADFASANLRLSHLLELLISP